LVGDDYCSEYTIAAISRIQQKRDSCGLGTQSRISRGQRHLHDLTLRTIDRSTTGR